MSEHDHSEHLIDLAQAQGILDAREIEAAGVPRIYLRHLCEEGRLRPLGRGFYSVPGAPVSQQHALALVAIAVPDGVVCLHSALHVHAIVNHPPAKVWLALPPGRQAPRIEQPPIHLVPMAEPGFSQGRMVHGACGVEVTVTTLAKTIVDCFAFQEELGLELALEALHKAITRRLVAIEEVWKQAVRCQLEQVLRPHLETAA